MTQALITRDELYALGVGEQACAGVDTADIDAAILAASSVAYSYLRARYRLPLVTWGSDLRRAVAKIAALDVLTVRGFDPSNPADAVLVKAADDATAWLKEVAANRAAADVVDTTPAPSSAPRVISNTPRGYRRCIDRRTRG